MKKPLSQELFEDMYVKLNNKISSESDTIFENINIIPDMAKNYNKFISSTYGNIFYLDESVYQKNLTIKHFIENEVLSDLLTEAYDIAVSKYNDRELSFKENFLFENTIESFNVRYKGHNKPVILEESFGQSIMDKTSVLSKLIGIGALSTYGLALGAFSAITVIGISALLPSRSARNWENLAEKALGVLGAGLLGSKSLFAMGNTSITNSNNNILNFDNIDTNPDVKKLFYTLSKTRNNKDSIKAIGSIVQDCLDNNDPLNDPDENLDKNYFMGLYSPRNNNVFTVALESLYKKNSDSKGTLIQYRKCLADKLVDIYKFLMIANISTNKDFKKIINIMKKGFNDKPEFILSFLSEDSETEQLNKENILTLTKFRIFLGDLAKDLRKGIFEVDKESGLYLEQKLKNIDVEIEEFVSNHQRNIETNFETQEEFRRKDFKFNKRPEKDFKRHLMNKSTRFNSKDNNDKIEKDEKDKGYRQR